MKKDKKIRNLLAVLSELQGDDLSNFLEDVATAKEITEMSQRLCAAQMLAEKKSVREISEKTGLSTTTVVRVSQWLRHGKKGYAKALEILAK